MEKIRKNQIINAVLSIIANGGMDQITLDKAAIKAGVSKGVVAYYFSNKEALILESCEAFLKQYSEGIRYLRLSNMEPLCILRCIAYSTLGRLEQLAALFPEVDESVQEAPDFILNYEECHRIALQIFGAMASDPNFKKMLENVYTEYLTANTEIIESYMRLKGLTTRNARIMAIQFMALIDGLLLYTVMGFQIDETVSVIEDFLENFI